MNPRKPPEGGWDEISKAPATSNSVIYFRVQLHSASEQIRHGGTGLRACTTAKRKTTMSQQGRILGIGGIFFKSANRQQMQEWYAKHLGLADSGHGVMLSWREKDNPENEQMTVWSIFPGNTKYFEPSSAQFMVNYIVDDLEALLDRLAKEGVRIDAKRQDESYGRFAWIYDPDGNKIELWQPHH
jgi:catechol 2,3-dioxygenase-like lactoylglutathione lyase family enzyme